jgi:ribosomal protein S18 acetylase RimI-like enzyme
MMIRRTTEEDWPVLKALRLASLLDAPTEFGMSHQTATNYSDSQWRERAAGRGQAQFLLAWANDLAVGLVGHTARPISELHLISELNLIAMWVKPEYRGTGTAAAIVEAVKAHAVSEGHTRVALDVAPDNERAAAFYRKQGFSFLSEWEALESFPNIQVQKMEWRPATY